MSTNILFLRKIKALALSMGRLMAFDYGSKRLGIAVSDPLQLIARGLQTIHPKDILSFLKEYMLQEELSAFIVGEPRQQDNSPSEISPQVTAFVHLLEKSFPKIPVYRVNERLTSQLAKHSLAESGLKKKARRDKALIDTVSATLILQIYMEAC